MPIRNLKQVATPGTGPVEEVHIEGVAAEGSAPTIADGSVTKAKLAAAVQASLGKADTALQVVPANGVATAMIANGAVTGAKIATATVATSNLVDKAVTAAKIADGVIPAAYVLPAAGAALGGVKIAAVTPLVKSADSKAAAGDAPTVAEFNAVVALANECKATINAMINAQRAAGQASSK